MTNSANLTMADRVAMLRLPDKTDQNGSAGRIFWLPWMLCVLLAFAACSLALRAYSAPPAMSQTPIEGAKTVTAAHAKAAAAPGETVLESKGYIIPAHQIQVSPIEVSGRIVELYIEEGKRFDKDGILAVLDKSSFDAQYLEAVANKNSAEAKLQELKNGTRPEEIAEAAAELRESEESLKQAKLKYERNKTLSPGAMSAEEFELAQYTYTSLIQKVNRLAKALELARLGPRQERIDGAVADVKLADARLKRAKWQLDNCTIRAPVAGTILKKTAELGNLVSASSFNATAMSLCDMADLSDLEVELDITERDIAKVVVGQPCRIRADAYPDRPYKGKVDRVMPIANRAKGAVPVRVKIAVPKDEEGRFLKPEMGAVVSFLAAEKK